MAIHVPSDHEIETFSGGYVNIADPAPSSIELRDIAHALANICRYGGHCQRFFSVAEHAVFVSKRLERQRQNLIMQLAGLHHDDAEAFLGDIPRPIKPLLGSTYEQMSDTMDECIIEALALPFSASLFHDGIIKAADNWALFVEARHLLPSGGKGWFEGGQTAQTWGLDSLPSRIVTPDYWYDGLQPEAAKMLFLKRHTELTERMSA